MDSKACNAAPSIHEFDQAIANLLLRHAAGDVKRKVICSGNSNDLAFSFHRTVRRDRCDHRATRTILTELQRIGVSGVGVPLSVFWAVVVTEKGMLNPCILDVYGIERRVWLLALSLLS